MEQSVLSKIENVSKRIDPLFPNMSLPLEVTYLILSKLPIEHLERLWVFNKDWFILTKVLCFDFYRSVFQESTLWKSLPKDPMVQNIPLPDYFSQFLDQSWSTILRSEKCINLEKFIVSQAMSDKYLDKLLVGIDREGLVEEEKCLIQQRQASEEESFTDFMKNSESPLAWLDVAKAYRHIEATLNILLLAHFIFNDRTSFTESILLMLDRRLTRWLTGPGLEILVEHTNEPKKLLLNHLINFALGEGNLFLGCSDKKQRDIYQENAKELLYRLTDDDCWSLAITQSPIVVDAIERRCFPLIDRFGQKTLVDVMGKNPNEKMLLVLLERFGAAQLSSVLVSLGVEKSFQKIVSSYSQFMGLLLSQLRLEQLCDMVNELRDTWFFYLISGSPFLEFLKILPVESESKEEFSEKAIVSVSSKVALIKLASKITCTSRILLLNLAQLQPYFIPQIIKSSCIDYLLSIDILMFLKKYPALWDVLPVEVLDKFKAQELLALAAINIKAVPCIVKRKYLESKFADVKNLIEFALRYMEDSTVPEVTRAEIINTVQSLFNAWHQTVNTTNISNDIIEPLRYWHLFLRVEKLKDKDLEWLETECKKDTPVIYTAMLQKTEGLQNQRRHPKQLDAPIPVIKIVPTDDPKIPSTYPTLPSGHQNNSVTVSKKATESQPISQKPIQLQKQESASSNNASTNIALSFLKGFGVGILVMIFATLLLMFINYQLNVPLLETINNLWIAGIIGAFAEIVATACFLVDAKVFEPSNSGFSNENPDNSKPFKVLDPVSRTVDSTCGTKPFFSDVEIVDTSKSQVQPTLPTPNSNTNGKS